MNAETQTLEKGRTPDSTAAPAPDGAAAPAAADYPRASRLHLWLILAGFGMMFLASILMWVRFGPAMFVDLATAVANCF